jgi:hypothetical protein
VTGDERFRELTGFGLMTAPSGAGAVVIHAEEGLDSHVVLGVVRLADKAHKVAIVTFRGCMQAVFGYPNDEAYWRDPRGADGDRPGYGFCEVVSSTWPGRLIAYNRHACRRSVGPSSPRCASTRRHEARAGRATARTDRPSSSRLASCRRGKLTVQGARCARVAGAMAHSRHPGV